MKMNAIRYELIMCHAFECERFGMNGMADADVYREIASSEIYKESDGFNPKKFGAIQRVCSNVSSAIDQMKKDYEYDSNWKNEIKELINLRGKYYLEPNEEELTSLLEETIGLVNIIKGVK